MSNFSNKSVLDENFNQYYICLLFTSKNDFSEFLKIEDFKDLFLIISDLENFFSLREFGIKISICEGKIKISSKYKFSKELFISDFMNSSYIRTGDLKRFIQNTLAHIEVHPCFNIYNYKTNLYSLLNFTKIYIIDIINKNKIPNNFLEMKINEIDNDLTLEKILETYEYKYNFKIDVLEYRGVQAQIKYSEKKRKEKSF